jgi:mono/diheme cytochrome c family protein
MLKSRGFRATSTPPAFETVAARSIRDFAIPGAEHHKTNPDANDWTAVQQGREDFLARCASCHGVDARGRTPIGANVYPRVPDLRSDSTQNLSDGEIHYIIQNGIQLTGMPAMASPHRASAAENWKLVAYIRCVHPKPSLSYAKRSCRSKKAGIGAPHRLAAGHKWHADIYEHWKKTPMANVVRDPREHPDAIIPDLHGQSY